MLPPTNRKFTGPLVMSIKELEEQIIQFKHQQPFRPFEVELLDGRVIKIRQPNLSINETGAAYLSSDEGIVNFDFDEVRCFHPQSKIDEANAMKTQEFEGQIIELIHKKPFRPFAVEMEDGRIIEIRRPSVVINGGGAGYISEDYDIEDFELDEVRNVHPLKRKAKR